MHTGMATELRYDNRLLNRPGPLARMLSLCEKAGEYVEFPATPRSIRPGRAPAAQPAAPAVQPATSDTAKPSVEPPESLGNPFESFETDMQQLSLGGNVLW